MYEYQCCLLTLYIFSLDCIEFMGNVYVFLEQRPRTRLKCVYHEVNILLIYGRCAAALGLSACFHHVLGPLSLEVWENL